MLWACREESVVDIEVIQSTRSDNLFCLLSDAETGEAILIDPIDAEEALRRVEEKGLSLRFVVNTHWHPDHTGGNSAVLNACPDAVLAVPEEESGLIQGGQVVLKEGDFLPLGKNSKALRVIRAPGHTVGHICLYARGHLFSGDVIFVAGAGNTRFGGDANVLARMFLHVLPSLPDDTVFYPGHDYARRNLEFCLHVEPDNAAAKAFLEGLGSLEASDPVLVTLGQERVWSPFMRVGEEALQARLEENFASVWDEASGESRAERAFVTLRKLRDTW